MLLENKNAVIYGAGSVGGAVAAVFAREGATVFLASRTQPRLDAIAKTVRDAGGSIDTARVDALDAASVGAHLDEVVRRAGRIDVVFNAVSVEDVQGVALTDIPFDTFMQPIALSMRTQFVTVTEAARRMTRQKSGVILALTATPARVAFPYGGGFGVACAATESLWRQLAAELGPHGVRVVCVRSSGSPDAPEVRRAIAQHARANDTTAEAFTTMLDGLAPLHRMPLLAEVANVIAMMASDRASAVTGAIANVSCGALMD